MSKLYHLYTVLPALIVQELAEFDPSSLQVAYSADETDILRESTCPHVFQHYLKEAFQAAIVRPGMNINVIAKVRFSPTGDAYVKCKGTRVKTLAVGNSQRTTYTRVTIILEADALPYDPSAMIYYAFSQRYGKAYEMAIPRMITKYCPPSKNMAASGNALEFLIDREFASKRGYNKDPYVDYSCAIYQNNKFLFSFE